MSLSTVRLLKLPSMPASSARCSSGGEMARSVQITAMVEASCGAIIPLPLQMAVMRPSLRPTRTGRLAILMMVSVVQIASAADSGAALSCALSRGSASIIFAFGQPLADHAGRAPSAPTPGATSSTFAVGGAQLHHVLQALGAGERVGVARVDQHRAHAAHRQPPLAVDHRRGLGLVDGQRTAAALQGVSLKTKREVFLERLDAGVQAGEQKTRERLAWETL